MFLVLTGVTGIVDAVSILGLGRVFVANMTGNVVFIGFALAGAPGFSVTGSFSALAGFLAGALLAGMAMRRTVWSRPRLLLAGLTAESFLVLVALGVALVGGSVPASVTLDVVAAAVATSMGIQNTMVRRLAMPDMTTTVLTLTLTGLAADLPVTDRAATARRALSVAAMLCGALIGALLVLAGRPPAGLALAAALLVLLTAVTARAPGRLEGSLV